MKGKGLRAGAYAGVLGAMAVVIYVVIDHFNVTPAGTIFMTVVAIVMALSSALLIFGTRLIWPVRALTPIIAAVLSVAAAWVMLPNLTAPEIDAQIRLEMDALHTSFTGRAEIKDCKFVGDNTATNLTIIDQENHSDSICAVEVRYDHDSVKAVPMGTMTLADLQNFPSSDFRTIRLWFPADGTIIIFVYRPGMPVHRQDVQTQDRRSFTALSTRYMLGEAD
jgi:hypothetical protein